MKNKLFALLLAIFCVFCLVSCNNKQEVVVDSVEVVSQTIPTEILTTEVEDKIDDIEIKVIKSDKSEETVKLNKSMISESDLAKLATEGSHEITITYEGKTVVITLTIKLPVDNRYSAKVLYPDNSPVTSGVTVQWCVGDMCFLPQAVNSDGMAYIELEDGDYYIHLNNVPEGYTYNPNAYITSSSNKHVEIKLYQLSVVSGEGNKENPFVVSTGAYNVSYEEAKTAGMKYYSFTPTEAGTYTIESICVDKLAMSVVDPYIGFVGTDITSAPDTTGNDIKDSVNFSRSFEAEANTTYYFIIMISSVSDNKFPCNVEFVISKA